MSELKKVYFLSDYNWECGYVVSEGPKNLKIKHHYFQDVVYTVPRAKCAWPDEQVCVVWEMWKGRNGRGGYRVERELYPEDRIPANMVYRQDRGPHLPGEDKHGRVWENEKPESMK